MIADPVPATDGEASPLDEAEATLRRGLAEGRPNHALFDIWPVLGAFADRDPARMAAIMREASEARAAEVTGALVEGDALAFAQVTASGRLMRASERFREWIEDPSGSADCLDLVREALAGQRASGRVRTLRHGVLAALAVADPASSPWPDLARREGLDGRPGDVLLVVFAPSRSQVLVERAALALGLSALQKRIAMALLEEPTLEAAARSIGVGRETAKDALDGALRKAGVRRASLLVGRLIDLSCQLTAMNDGEAAAAGGALGLSPMESAVAARLADGDTAEDAAVALGLRPATVKAYRRGMFEKLGISRARDLRRLLSEARELGRLSDQREVGLQPSGEGELRIFHDPSGRVVACLDYGPPRGRPLVLMHGYWTGRTAPPPLLAALRATGHRVIIPQRPGFGLTTPPAGDYVRAAVDDMVMILDRFGASSASILARDGGAATALAFGTAHPDRVDIGVLQNPRRPIDSARRPKGPLASISGLLLKHPGLLEPYARMLLRQSRWDLLVGALRRSFASVDADRVCFDDPMVVTRMVTDLIGLTGRSAFGGIAEQRLYAEGWRIPVPYVGPSWRLALSGHYYAPGDEEAWRSVTAGAPVVLLEAGVLAQFTHAETLASLFAG